VLLQVLYIERLLGLARRASTDDPDRVLASFREDDQNKAATNGTDGDETLLQVGVLRVVDLQEVDFGCEERPGALEADAVLRNILALLLRVLFEPHPRSVGQRRTTSVAYP
jgi:hypothetical protein